MKTILLSLLFAMPIFAQQGFRGEKGTIVWERTFPATNTDIGAMLALYPNIKIASASGGIYKGTAEDIKTTGGSLLLKNPLKFDFTINVTADSYVVKVTGVKILERYGPLQLRIIPTGCEKYFMYNNKIKADQRTKSDLAYMETSLSSLFVPVTGEPLTSK